MNPKYNTICIQFVNYLSNHLSSTNSVPAQILHVQRPAIWLLVCYHVLCLAENPTPDTRLVAPDPTRMIYQPLKTNQSLSWKYLEALLCCVMCSNTPNA